MQMPADKKSNCGQGGARGCCKRTHAASVMSSGLPHDLCREPPAEAEATAQRHEAQKCAPGTAAAHAHQRRTISRRRLRGKLVSTPHDCFVEIRAQPKSFCLTSSNLSRTRSGQILPDVSRSGGHLRGAAVTRLPCRSRRRRCRRDPSSLPPPRRRRRHFEGVLFTQNMWTDSMTLRSIRRP